MKISVLLHFSLNWDSVSFISPASTRKIYELGIESIPSESECYPAKLAHGHVQWLINQGVKHIFYPSIPYERKEFADSDNHYNCPIVTSYPENIKNNMDPIVHGEVDFIHPFLNFESEDTISYRLIDELGKKIFLFLIQRSVLLYIKHGRSLQPAVRT